MEAVATRLPRPSAITRPIAHFLAEQFQSEADLHRSPDIEAELARRCSDLEDSLNDLRIRLSKSVAAYAVRSEEVGALLDGVQKELFDLRSSLRGSSKGYLIWFLILI